MTGWSHIAISVTDLERSLRWYVDVLGFRELLPFDTEAFERRLLQHRGGVVLSLTRHRSTVAADRFDPARVGLDHVALGVEDIETLEVWAAHLEANGVEHSGVAPGGAPGTALVAVHDPDGIQVEFYVRPSG